MAISTAEGSKNSEAITPLLDKGQPSLRSKSGGWRSASFILGSGALERFAYRGLECNLINYLTGPLGESVAVAAGNVNLWIGLGSFMPVLGAFVADSFLGLYRTNIITAIVYILGLGLSTLSVVLISLSNSNDQATSKDAAAAVPTALQVLFFVSLYLVASAQGYQSSIQVFRADQLDRQHPEESKAKRSFLNWWLFGITLGVALAILVVPYIQENIGWSMGFGIPCLAMVLGLILLLVGNTTYRFAVTQRDEDSPHGNGSICSSSQEENQEALITNPQQNSNSSRSLNKALSLVKDSSSDVCSSSFSKNNKVGKTVLRLLPIWCTTLMYTIAWAQSPTLFTKQATTLDKSIGQFKIPSASIRVFIPLTTMCFTPIYDQVFIPIARMITRDPSGISKFQRIKIGMTISFLNMVVAALVEMRRLEIARDYGLVDIPNAIVPLSFWWLVPQNVLCSIAYVFAQVGMQKFFYDEVPKELRIIGLSLSFGAYGVGNFLSSFLIYAIDKLTSINGGESWFSDNLNRAHLDYFYWVLAGLGFLGLTIFALFAKSYYDHHQENVVQGNPQA